mmetsp:Transcript_57719/g.162782  ORF Transcript_57719/g.162782 Transcript_57719/m.162782 type:complete len:230 (+) Transcript_57719:348-1037(+)
MVRRGRVALGLRECLRAAVGQRPGQVAPRPQRPASGLGAVPERHCRRAPLAEVLPLGTQVVARHRQQRAGLTSRYAALAVPGALRHEEARRFHGHLLRLLVAPHARERRAGVQLRLREAAGVGRGVAAGGLLRPKRTAQVAKRRSRQALLAVVAAEVAARQREEVPVLRAGAGIRGQHGLGELQLLVRLRLLPAAQEVDAVGVGREDHSLQLLRAGLELAKAADSTTAH